MIDVVAGRVCVQCGEQKPATAFSWKDGHRRLASRCHDCRRANYKENPQRARDRAAEYYRSNRDSVLERDRDRRRTHIAETLVVQAKGRARALGLPFDLTPADVPVPELCPVLGIPLFVREGHSGPNSPTLDRVVPALGYVRGNVVVVSHRANTIKSDATLAELVAVVRFYGPLYGIANDVWSALAIAVTYAEQEAAR